MPRRTSPMARYLGQFLRCLAQNFARKIQQAVKPVGKSASVTVIDRVKPCDHQRHEQHQKDRVIHTLAPGHFQIVYADIGGSGKLVDHWVSR